MSKIHIALNNEDFKSSKWKRRTAERTSDNYVLYIRHPNISNCILILGIISPYAHNRIEDDQSLIQKLIEIANSFTNLDNEDEILECDNFAS
ncbi:type II toxin-antitoxin system YafO family toxin [Actinobacillus minor]|uniref:type II toxin-antitoxin system YafO family toxin n=1 Tax=Actinobacillus minor TaxID=51047 RepID=UPI00389AF8D1